MFSPFPLVNPHPINLTALARVHDRILADLIALHRADLAPEPRRRLAGIPPLVTLEAEQQRRESARREAA